MIIVSWLEFFGVGLGLLGRVRACGFKRDDPRLVVLQKELAQLLVDVHPFLCRLLL